MTVKKDLFHIDSRVEANPNQYVVKEGDTLFSIAKAMGVSLENLISANKLESSMIYPNQILVIPKEVTNGAVYFEEYITEDNDSIEAIAQKLGVRVDLLMKYNDVTKLLLKANQVIKVPKSYHAYIVLPTDTLESILKMANMTLEELVKANLAVWLAPGNSIMIR